MSLPRKGSGYPPTQKGVIASHATKYLKVALTGTNNCDYLIITNSYVMKLIIAGINNCDL